MKEQRKSEESHDEEREREETQLSNVEQEREKIALGN